MFRTEIFLAGDQDWRFLALAGLVCAVAIVAAISLLRRARSVHGPARAGWFAGAIFTTAVGEAM